MKIFNDTWTRPQACQDADPDLSYCQLLGKYRMEFPKYNSIEIYSNMNEKCPSLAPEYYRPEGC